MTFEKEHLPQEKRKKKAKRGKKAWRAALSASVLPQSPFKDNTTREKKKPPNEKKQKEEER